MAVPHFTDITDDVKALFWAKVDIRGPDDCWLWTGASGDKGYGRFKVNSGFQIASRVVLAISLGRWPERHELACHKCDNPPCVNPSHLWAGSSDDNMKDAARKGRTYKWNGERAGESNPRAKLTANDVRYIRSSKATNRALAKELGVSSTSIADVRTGLTWGLLT